MLSPIDNYFAKQDEPAKSCLLVLRGLLLAFDPAVTETWKYGMPFYYFHGRMFCYLWIHNKYRQPYLGVVRGQQIHHPKLISEKRARMKILLLDPAKDIPVKTIFNVLSKVRALYI